MSTRIVLNSEQVLSIASQIEADNQELQNLMNDSKATIDNLASTWTGGAADQTRASYDSFAQSPEESQSPLFVHKPKYK